MALLEHKLHTLKNGLRIVLVPERDSTTATVLVMTGTGSRYENVRENGLAHFLEHMFFKGTKRRPNARLISEELDGIGSSYNAFTSKERTAYYAKVGREYLDTALDVISDIFLNSTLPPREITKERGAVIQEINMYEDMPIRTVDTVFDALIFGADHPLGRTILGPKENILRFTRKDFDQYLKRNYAPRNTIVCVAGSFNESAVLATIKRLFGKLAAGKQPEALPFSGEQTTPRVAIKHKATDQTQLIIGVPAYPYEHKDEYALDVMANILGGGMSSRLFWEVRERRGLAYYVRGWAEKYPDTGYFAVQAGVEHKNLERTIQTILGEFRKIRRMRVTTVELKKAKSHIKGSLPLELETSDAIAENYATSLVNLGRIRTMDEIKRGIDAVSAADVERVARDILKTEKLNLAIIGPHTSEQDLKNLLRI